MEEFAIHPIQFQAAHWTERLVPNPTECAVWDKFQQRHTPDPTIRATLGKLRRARCCSCCVLPTVLGRVTGALANGLQK